MVQDQLVVAGRPGPSCGMAPYRQVDQVWGLLIGTLQSQDSGARRVKVSSFVLLARYRVRIQVLSFSRVRLGLGLLEAVLLLGLVH